MAYNLRPPTPTVRREQYTSKAHLEIRALGTEEWYEPPAYDIWKSETSNNLIRATFTPGHISLLQQAVRPTYGDDRRLESALYMWNATFSTTDLHDIRVKEYEFGRPQDGTENPGRLRIEMMAVCKVAPVGQGLFVRESTLIEHIYNNAKETSEPTASSSGLAKISERWASGEQEIKLTFTRTTQTERNPGKNKPKGRKEPVTGAKVWVWYAFLAFLSGETWTSATFAQFKSAAQLTLAEIVGNDHNNPHVDFEKKEDGWFLIKMKNANAEQQRLAARAARFGTTDTAGPFTAKPSVLPVRPAVLPPRPSASVLGKRTMTESEEMAGSRKRVEADTRSVMEELNKARGRVEILEGDEGKLEEEQRRLKEEQRRLKEEQRRLKEEQRKLRVRLAEQRERVRRLEEELEEKR